MEDYVVAYTLSDRGNLVSQCRRSLESLSKFIEKDKIYVFFTPPRSKESIYKLSKYAEIIESENITEPFVFRDERGSGFYGEKVQICDLDDENVIFLDCDTEVKKELSPLLDYNYDFAGRMEMQDYDIKGWVDIFKKYNKEIVPMFNSGFFIFKNKMHKKIKNEWMKYLKKDFPKLHASSYQKDQYTLALAVSGFNIKYLTKNEHAFIWKNEEHLDTYVLHGKNSKFKYVRLMLRHSPFRRMIKR